MPVPNSNATLWSTQVTKDFWPYWRKTVERFKQLSISSLEIGQYDVSRNQLPDVVELDSLPALVMFPAKDKAPPLKLFHGKAKVRPIMLWAQEVARCGALGLQWNALLCVLRPNLLCAVSLGCSAGAETHADSPVTLLPFHLSSASLVGCCTRVHSIKFEYPNDTPHLDDEQREAYLVQIKERDERVGAERAKAKAERIEKLRREAAGESSAKQEPQQEL
jgi:hypothetical protein